MRPTPPPSRRGGRVSFDTPEHELLDPARARAKLLAAGLAVDEVTMLYRRVLEDGGVAAYRLQGRDANDTPVTTLGYVRWGPPTRMAAIADKWLGGRAEPGPFGDGVRRLPGSDALLFLSPNDRELRLLPQVVDRGRLKRLLAPLPPFEPAGFRIREKRSTLTVLRYKPEQRLVARASLAIVNQHDETHTLEAIVRVFADARGATLASDVLAWRASGAAGVLPTPLGAVADGHVHAELAVRGDTLRQAIRAGTIAPAHIAGALVTLHTARPSLVARRTSAARLALVQRILATLDAHGVPDTASLAHALADRCPDERTDTPVHGDLHARQMLVHEGVPVFVDFERAAMGDANDDLGNLLAHLRWEHATMDADGAAAGPFAEALAHELRSHPAYDLAGAARFFEACALVEIAELPVRRRMSTAAEIAGRAVTMAYAALTR